MQRYKEEAKKEGDRRRDFEFLSFPMQDKKENLGI
jgi:hypothetical protein